MNQQPIGVPIIVLDKDKKQVLLGRRLNAYRSGLYGMPGGRLDLEESLVDCVKRELLEETGMKAKSVEYVGVVRELQGDYNFIHIVYLCTDYSGKPQLVEPNKSEEWKWFKLDNLPKKILPGHKAAIDIYLNPNKPTVRDLI
jgi:8-oxo-dGTP diphosphatase